MTRRKLMRKLSALPLDEEIARTYLRWFPSKQLFTDPRTLPDLDSRHLFGDEQPMCLEIGCGTAEYLRELARDDPQSNFVGVDLAHKPLLHAVRMAAAQALPNIRFIRGDFKLMYPLLVADSLRAVYVHFPDPHVQARFRKRRIVTPAFLDAVYHALVVGGQLSIMTDHQRAVCGYPGDRRARRAPRAGARRALPSGLRAGGEIALPAAVGRPRAADAAPGSAHTAGARDAIGASIR
jgi:tRNA (guanine-N7-)-methyltransferase